MTVREIEKFNKIVKHPRFWAIISRIVNVNVECEYPQKYEIFVKALSIKSRGKRIEYIYDNACNTIDRYNEEHGLMCVFENNRCIKTPKDGRVNGCCCRCIYQTQTGCPSSNLSCKLYFCEPMQKLGRTLCYNDFYEFKLLSLRQRYIIKNNYYCKRERFLRLLKIESMIVFFVFSIIKSTFIFKGERINNGYMK